ncbi:MAG TPA: RDD family protein [Steroidobacteraceae bacterium]|nr:RDD family protein [Steroidobacteraceae bacterium]
MQDTNTEELEYVGFWPRVAATLIDTVLIVLICWPMVTVIYGWRYWTSGALIQGPADFVINWVLPAIAVVIFWLYRQATPGKIAIGARIVDAETGEKPSTAQFVGRYFGYYVSTIPLLLGFVWVAFDSRKQGWHDKLAGTVVVRAKHRRPDAVRFRQATVRADPKS